MTLKISGERKSQCGGHYADTGRCVIPNSLLSKAWSGDKPEISYAEIDGNRVLMDIEYFRGGIGMNDPADIPLSINFSQKEPRKGRLEIGLNGSGKYDFIFQTKNGFHYVTSTIFRPGNLEAESLKLPDSLQADLKYKTPLSIWKTLPNDLLNKIESFGFEGQVFKVQYDDKKNVFICGIRSILDSVPEEDKKVFLDKLIRTGIVNKLIGEDSIRQCYFFDVPDAQKIKQPDSLSILEEIVTIVPEKMKSNAYHDKKAQLHIKGIFPTNIFSGVDRIFDEAKDSIGINAHVEGANISINVDGRETGVTLKDSSLEVAEHLIRVGPKGGGYWTGIALDGASLKVRDRENKRTYNLVEECKENI